MPASSNLSSKPKVRGPQRTSREDWISVALDTLICEGVDNVKVLVLAEKLGCARSSFYWYFKNRDDLLNSLLDHWQSKNTTAIVSKAGLSAETVNGALINVFTCWADDRLFDTRLDFAIRDWSRRSKTVRRALDVSDAARLDALAGMFERYGNQRPEAEVRARIVYYTQIGYNALDVRETPRERAKRGADYLHCMTGEPPLKHEVDTLIGLLGLTQEDLGRE